MQQTILRSTTGVYHLGLGRAAHCNGRSGKFVRTSVEKAKQANKKSFCKKCFPCGLEYSLEKDEIKED